MNRTFALVIAKATLGAGLALGFATMPHAMAHEPGWHDAYALEVGDDNADGTIEEDESGWDCREMGNRICGPGAVLPDGTLAVPGDYTAVHPDGTPSLPHTDEPSPTTQATTATTDTDRTGNGLQLSSWRPFCYVRISAARPDGVSSADAVVRVGAAPLPLPRPACGLRSCGGDTICTRLACCRREFLAADAEHAHRDDVVDLGGEVAAARKSQLAHAVVAGQDAGADSS